MGIEDIITKIEESGHDEAIPELPLVYAVDRRTRLKIYSIDTRNGKAAPCLDHQPTSWCHTCRTSKAATAFVKDARTPDQLSYRCKQCSHDYYLRRKQDYYNAIAK